METLESESATSNKVKPESQQQASENRSNSLPNKQNSIFSLTIDEIHFRSGKSFGSMNMDELLTSVWNVEENLGFLNSIRNETSDENAAPQANLARQGSFSIPSPLCNKTVEEVWEEIQRNQSERASDIVRNETLGEMTLEDFLVKVGVVQETSTLASPPGIVKPFQNHRDNACLEARIGAEPMAGVEFSHPNSEKNILGTTSPVKQFVSGPTFVGESSQNIGIGNRQANGVHDIGEQLVRRRSSNGSMELAVERRQRRMIKNRESAARSRARKQAYTAELEIELNQLREENAKLKLILTEAENRLVQEVSKAKTLASERITEKCKTLRKTTSLSW